MRPGTHWPIPTLQLSVDGDINGTLACHEGSSWFPRNGLLR